MTSPAKVSAELARTRADAARPSRMRMCVCVCALQKSKAASFLHLFRAPCLEGPTKALFLSRLAEHGFAPSRLESEWCLNIALSQRAFVVAALALANDDDDDSAGLCKRKQTQVDHR